MYDWKQAVFCPWCNNIMEFSRPQRCDVPVDGGYFRAVGQCTNCGATSPPAIARSPEEAIMHAQDRAKKKYINRFEFREVYE